jgi:hypothetical protein
MANPTLKAQRLYDYEQETDGTRTLIATAADGTGFTSLTNDVGYWDVNGNFVPIFSPASGARPPRIVDSRSWAYIEDGQATDQQKWNIDVGAENWGIAAPSSALTVNAPTGGGAQSYQLSAAATASGGNTVYTGTNLGGLVPSAYVVIAGFLTSANNGTFQVQSSTPTTVTVNNPSGVSETDPASLTTDNALYPTTLLNGWAPYGHVGAFEQGGDLSYNFGLENATVNGYSNPGNAFDGVTTTAATAIGIGTHQYWGCVWSFAAPPQTLTGLTLQVLSEVPFNGEISPIDGSTVVSTNRSAGVWYSLDGGNTWTQIYNTTPRTKQWDQIAIPNGQNLSNVQVMAFTDSHDNMSQYVYEINIIGTTTGTGPITLFSGRIYYTSFNNSSTGHFSDVSPASTSSGAVTGGSLPLTEIPVSTDPQVDTVYILATADGGDPSILYYITSLPNGTTSYQDGTPESTLLLNNIYVFTDSAGNVFGLIDNDVPPTNADFPLLHLGRLYMAGGQFIYFSKNISELTTPSGIVAGVYEESWPTDNTLDISNSAENITALYSDGQVLYVATDRHIRRVLGDSPINFTIPQIVFSEVGVICQDVWQTVFLESTPVGAMWLTPDFRVILADFNTYNDVGVPIQGTLNSINPNVPTVSWAQFIAYGEYAFYCLAIPTGTNTSPDTLCIFDMRLKKWYLWRSTDTFSAGIYYVSLGGTPRFMVTDESGTQRVFDPTQVVDDGTESDSMGIVSTMQTNWLDFGDPLLKKYFNEIQTDTTQSDMLVTVQGATNRSDFANPNVVVSQAALVQNAWNEYKTFPAGYSAVDRFYNITWTDTSSSQSTTADVLLGSWSAEVIPLNRY